MNNPFIGEGDTVHNKGFDSLLPLELNDDFETSVSPVVKRKKLKKFKLKKVLIINNGVPDNNLFIQRKPNDDGLYFSDFKNAWRTYRKKEKYKKVELKTTDVLRVEPIIKHKYIKSLDGNIKEFSEFLLNEISPVENAFESAIDNIKQTLELITESEIDSTPLATMRAMLRDSLNIKALTFISNKLKLSKKDKAVLIERYFKPKTTNVFPTLPQQRSPRDKKED